MDCLICHLEALGLECTQPRSVLPLTRLEITTVYRQEPVDDSRTLGKIRGPVDVYCRKSTTNSLGSAVITAVVKKTFHQSILDLNGKICILDAVSGELHDGTARVFAHNNLSKDADVSFAPVASNIAKLV